MAHQPVAILVLGPAGNQSMESFFVRFSLGDCPEAGIREPSLLPRGATEASPFSIIPATDCAPPAIPAGKAAMRRGNRIAITITISDYAVRRIVQQREADELQAGLVL